MSIQNLNTLLQDLFTLSELRQLLTARAELLALDPHTTWTKDKATAVFTLTQLMDRRGLINADFFDLLVARRDKKAKKIREVAQAFKAGPKRKVDTEPPPDQGGWKRYVLPALGLTVASAAILLVGSQLVNSGLFGRDHCDADQSGQHWYLQDRDGNRMKTMLWCTPGGGSDFAGTAGELKLQEAVQLTQIQQIVVQCKGRNIPIVANNDQPRCPSIPLKCLQGDNCPSPP